MGNNKNRLRSVVLLAVPLILATFGMISNGNLSFFRSKKSEELKATVAFEEKERLGFDAIYLIHIPAAPKRLELTDRLLKPQNLDIIYWEAETPETFLTKALSNWGSGPNPGHMACISSHVSVYMDMIRRNVSTAFIMEDDLDLEMDMVNMWKEKSQVLPEMNWDFLYLGYCFEQPSRDNDLPTFPGWRRGVAACLHAYAVKTSYVRKFLDDMESPSEAIDVMLLHHMLREGSNSFFLEKPLFVQRPRTQENPSTIGTGNFLPDQPLVQSAWETLNRTMDGFY
jgi:GR25 family glycosyltransferase involved in LPS biosynthesis